MRGGSAAPEESFIAIGAVGYFGACRGWTSRSAAHDAPLCGPPEGSPDVWWKAVIRGSQGTNRMSEPGGTQIMMVHSFRPRMVAGTPAEG